MNPNMTIFVAHTVAQFTIFFHISSSPHLLRLHPILWVVGVESIAGGVELTALDILLSNPPVFLKIYSYNSTY